MGKQGWRKEGIKEEENKSLMVSKNLVSAISIALEVGGGWGRK